MPKPVRLRRQATDDIDAALAYYVREARAEVAIRFIDAVERATIEIGRHPRNGSLRFSYELDIPDLRTWPVRRFPYLIFYVETDDGVDVWRVLHARRHLQGLLAED